MFYGPQHRTIVLVTPSSCCLHHSCISQGWELCSGIAEATLHISHPILVNMLSHSELMHFPEEIQYMAEKGTFCPFQCLLSQLWNPALEPSSSSVFLQAWSFPSAIVSRLEHPLWIYSRIYFILAENIYTKNMRNLSCVLCLSILRVIYKANGLMQCHTILKKLYICKSLGTFQKFLPFQPPLTSQNLRHNYG